MNRFKKYEMYCGVMDTAFVMGVADKIEQIAFDVGYVALANDWLYDEAIKWALENIVEERVGEYTIVRLNEQAQIMAMEAYKKAKEEVIHCYKCGKSDVVTDEDCWTKEQYQHFSVSFGYGSKHDLESWSWTLCEDCLVDIIRTFKHVPNGFYHYSGFYPDKDRHQAVFEEWKKTGKWDYSYLEEEEEEEGND